MTHPPLPDLPTLAAQLRMRALGLVVVLAEWLGAGGLAAALRRRIARELGQLELYATGIVVLAALARTLHSPVRAAPSRPLAAPHGFMRVAAPTTDMRAMRRKLFPRERDLRRRLARFDATLADIGAAAARLMRHIAHIPPASRLIAVAPQVQRIAAVAGMCVQADDSS